MEEKIKMRITYGKAVKNVSDYMDAAGNKFTAFDGQHGTDNNIQPAEGEDFERHHGSQG
ncbi:MAG: hypothetical protein PHH85_02275 [Candidatus Methanoperedens sp.]|nr:hypothetical protein [Candidatus Methanoperedens sp.]